MLQLQPSLKQYAWGKLGDESRVAQLAALGGGVEQIATDEPYAELWLGTHSSGSAMARPAGSTGEWRPLGELHGEPLPFLLKVLSIRTALSIQAHPDAARARALHAARPDVYRDANHKPELAVALTPFEALAGLRPAAELAAALAATPELAAALGPAAAGALRAACESADGAGAADARTAAVRGALRALLARDAADVGALVGALAARLEAGAAHERGALLRKLHAEYPGDVGVLASLLLNHVRLEPGEALFMAANEPHAYLSGDCVECMATSDNVVRAGLTPKLKDADTLAEMLTYRLAPAEVLRGELRADAAAERRYAVPVRDFALARVDLAPGAAPHSVAPCASASVVLVTAGAGRVGASDAQAGSAFLVPAGAPLRLEASADAPLQAFVAHTNLIEA